MIRLKSSLLGVCCLAALTACKGPQQSNIVTPIVPYDQLIQSQDERRAAAAPENLLVPGALSTVNVGTSANDGTGDTLRAAFQKVNTNFTLTVENASGIATNLTVKGGSFNAITNTDLTADRVLVSSGTKVVTNSVVTPTEIGYVSGVTSALQAQINAKLATTNGTAQGLTLAGSTTNSAATANRVAIHNGAQVLTSSIVTDTEIGYVSGVTSALQAQINAKLATTNGTAQGLTLAGSTTNSGTLRSTGQILIQDGTAADPSIEFISDDDGTGTGFYRDGANAIGVSINGSEKWRWTGTGIFESIGAQTQRTSTGDYTIETGGANGNILLFPNGTGKVGVGGTPDYKLHVIASNNLGIKSETTGTDRAEFHLVKNSGTTRSWIAAVAGSANGHGVPDRSFYLADVTASASRLTIDTSGRVGLGQVAPSTKLHAQDENDTTVVTVTINTAQANITASDTFIDFRSTSGSEGSIAGTGAAGVLAYNTFTASHYTTVSDIDSVPENARIGALLEITVGKPDWQRRIRDTVTLNGITTTNYYEASRKDHLFNTRVARAIPQNKRAIGVFLGQDKEGRDMVASIGTCFIWVCSDGGDIQIGDFLCSSSTIACAQLQADDVQHTYTVAKATEAVDWSQEGGNTRKRIKCLLVGD